MERVAGIEWSWKHRDDHQHPRPTSPLLRAVLDHVANSPNVESWCLGDAVIGAWCSHRGGMLKMPLAGETVTIFEFPGEHEPFILKVRETIDGGLFRHRQSSRLSKSNRCVFDTLVDPRSTGVVASQTPLDTPPTDLCRRSYPVISGLIAIDTPRKPCRDPVVMSTLSSLTPSCRPHTS